MDSRELALHAAQDATDIGMSLTGVVYALIYIGDAVRLAAGHQVDSRVDPPSEERA